MSGTFRKFLASLVGMSLLFDAPLPSWGRPPSAPGQACIQQAAFAGRALWVMDVIKPLPQVLVHHLRSSWRFGRAGRNGQPQGVYLFDIDGTLADRDRPLPPEVIREITALLEAGARVIFVTGQNLDPAQRQRLVDPFPHHLRYRMRIYANEGGTKYTFSRLGRPRLDRFYQNTNGLTAEDRAELIAEIQAYAREKKFTLIQEPVSWSDSEVVIKLRASLADRESLARDILQRHQKKTRTPYRFSAAGQTTVAFLKETTTKETAIRDVLQSLPGASLTDMVYLDDEIHAGGNGLAAARIAGLTVVALNRDQATVPHGVRRGGVGPEAGLRWIRYLHRARARFGTLSGAVQAALGEGVPAPGAEFGAQERAALSRRPLVFALNLRDYLWGGDWINRLKGLPRRRSSLAAESWEIATHRTAPSRLLLSDGCWIELPELLGIPGLGERIIGRSFYAATGPRLPLLVKFLDTRLDLSVQVHPDDDLARRFGEADPGKEEDFLVLGAQPGSRLYLGLREGVQEQAFRNAVAAGQDVRTYMNVVFPRPGDLFRIPPGIVHAWGAGLQLVEIAGDSDLTYRLYDYGRQKPDRPLHPEKGIAAINFRAIQGDPLIRHLRRRWSPTFNPAVDEADLDSKIRVELIEVRDDQPFTGWTGDRFEILMVLAGRLTIEDQDGEKTGVRQGYSALLPAALGEFTLRPSAHGNTKAILIELRRPEEQDRIHIGVSAGGTKLAVGATDSRRRLFQGPRLLWRPELQHRGAADPQAFVALVAEQIVELIGRYSLLPSGIRKVGIAWPGPGEYARGIVSATFIPGFEDFPLAAELQRILAGPLGHPVAIEIVLDVVADLLGELRSENGAMKGRSNGMVLNMATGIAAALYRGGAIVETERFTPPGGTPLEIRSGVGQLGRHLIRRLNGTWIYRPTADGSVPGLEAGEERWSLRTGGPALARRYIAAGAQRFGADNVSYLGRRLGDIRVGPGSRDEILETAILQAVTEKALGGEPLARAFIRETGWETGLALRAFGDAYPEARYLDHVVLVGGVGENLGRGLEVDHRGENLFTRTIRETAAIGSLAPSSQGLEREFLAFAPCLAPFLLPMSAGRLGWAAIAVVAASVAAWMIQRRRHPHGSGRTFPGIDGSL